MPKFPLEISRKLKKLNCLSVKVLRRGLQIKSANLSDTATTYDFALGTYDIKPSSEYALIFNFDLPKRTSEVIIDTWGLTSSSPQGQNGLHHMSQSKINVVNRDTKVRFHTYPKTRFMFLTFKIRPDEDYTPDQTVTWAINYVYLEAKIASSKLIATPPVPTNMDLKYNIECVPQMLDRLELEPDQVMKEFGGPLHLEVHEHAVLKYLLGEESTSAYLTALKANIRYSGNDTSSTPHEDNNENLERLSKQLKELKVEMMSMSKELEESVSKIDNLTLHKRTLESTIDNTGDDIPLQKEKHENYMRLLRRLQEGLALKQNQVKSLKETNQSSGNKLAEDDQKNVNLVLDYYMRRIQNDRKTLEQSLLEAEGEWKTFQDETLRPVEGKQSADQGRLDKLLVHYRTQQKDSTKIKEELDNLVVRFMIDWYQLIKQVNK